MTNLEIKQKIDANTKIIETLLSPTTFTLNNSAKEVDLTEKIEAEVAAPEFPAAQSARPG